MKTNISKSNFSFRLLLVILATLGLLIMPGLCITSASAEGIPYDQNEVQKLRAFLASQSMTPGKTNADLLGMDINNPGTWAKWGGNDWIPRPSAQHAVDIQWKSNYLAGSLDISEFSSLGYFVLDCFDDVTNKFDNISIRNNPGLVWGVILHSVKVNELRITGNEGLHHLELNGKVDVLTLDQPDLGYLDIGTLGNIPPDLTKCTKLQTLKLGGIKNIPNWNIANFPNLETVYLDGLRNITSLNPINCPKLGGIGINNMPDLESIKLDNLKNLVGITLSGTSIKELDLTCAPNLVTFGLFFDSALTTLKIKDKPRFQFLELKGNQALRSLEVSGSDSLDHFRCHYNEKLEEIILEDLPNLGWIMAFSNAFKKIDISGLPAIKDVWLSTNQLTEFKAEGVVLEHLDLKDNKLTEVSANVGGHNIHLKAYGKGGYVGFDAGPGYWKPYGIQMEYKELPAPYTTILKEVKGTGFPPKENDYEGGFLFEKDIDATFYFKADIYFVNYFGDLEGDLPEEDEGEWDSDANLDYQSIVGEPFKLPEEYPSPSKTGFEIQGWYSDSTLTHEWNFEKDTLRGQLILYPNWIPAGMPTVLSVKRQSPSIENTSTNKVTYLVAFSKTVSGVDVSDFKLTMEGTVSGKIASVSAANGNTISVEVSGITGTGNLRLDVKNTGTGIIDGQSNPLAGGFTKGETYRFGTVTAINNDIQAEKSCRVFPNPASGKLQIIVPDNAPIKKIEVFSSLGNKITGIDFPAENLVDLTGLKTGIYLLRVSTVEAIFSHVIIKNR